MHGDIQLSQFLYTNDKSKVKLNDFNRAEFMLWDDENGEYCRYTNGRGHGNVSDIDLRFVLVGFCSHNSIYLYLCLFLLFLSSLLISSDPLLLEVSAFRDSKWSLSVPVPQRVPL